jgi:hypothetical protein
MLLWPDSTIVRFFYQNKLELRNPKDLKVIEFGCGSAANLLPFIQAGWQAFGVDKNSKAAFLDSGDQSQVFISHDLNMPLPQEICNTNFDVILFPQILYYLTDIARRNLLIWTESHLNKNGLWFLTERATNDYRAVNSSLMSEIEGSKIAKISFSETGESGLAMRFWDKDTLRDNLSTIFDKNPDELQVLSHKFENVSRDRIIQNSDLLVWGHK